jgi:hypothetical protein
MHSHWIKPVRTQSVSSHLLEKAILFLRASKEFTDFTPAFLPVNNSTHPRREGATAL